MSPNNHPGWGLKIPGRPPTPSEGYAQQYDRVGPQESQRLVTFDNGTCLTFGPYDLVDEFIPGIHPFGDQVALIDRSILDIRAIRARYEPRPTRRQDEDVDSQMTVIEEEDPFNNFRTTALDPSVLQTIHLASGTYYQVPSKYASVCPYVSVYSTMNKSDIPGEGHRGLTTDTRFGVTGRIGFATFQQNIHREIQAQRARPQGLRVNQEAEGTEGAQPTRRGRRRGRFSGHDDEQQHQQPGHNQNPILKGNQDRREPIVHNALGQPGGPNQVAHRHNQIQRGHMQHGNVQHSHAQTTKGNGNANRHDLNIHNTKGQYGTQNHIQHQLQSSSFAQNVSRQSNYQQTFGDNSFDDADSDFGGCFVGQTNVQNPFTLSQGQQILHGKNFNPNILLGHGAHEHPYVDQAQRHLDQKFMEYQMAKLQENAVMRAFAEEKSPVSLADGFTARDIVAAQMYSSEQVIQGNAPPLDNMRGILGQMDGSHMAPPVEDCRNWTAQTVLPEYYRAQENHQARNQAPQPRRQQLQRAQSDEPLVQANSVQASTWQEEAGSSRFMQSQLVQNNQGNQKMGVQGKSQPQHNSRKIIEARGDAEYARYLDELNVKSRDDNTRILAGDEFNCEPVINLLPPTPSRTLIASTESTRSGSQPWEEMANQGNIGVIGQQRTDEAHSSMMPAFYGPLPGFHVRVTNKLKHGSSTRPPSPRGENHGGRLSAPPLPRPLRSPIHFDAYGRVDNMIFGERPGSVVNREPSPADGRSGRRLFEQN